MVIKLGIEKINHLREMTRFFNKYGYKVGSMNECEKIIANDQVPITIYKKYRLYL
ncbi:hypothetical protein [Clostridium estertheticum]|uniref:hypothetical protein n=1 Tax=Clostridium estertheticum TaxID=238834 RepID=UPI001C0E22FD|nr:hypothetical protein [Clostridium estertheticum]MBU3072830.1 hypothetical protein [Clostridium estertheticum]MBU3163133.1 hypothetical protein [Clostridium estertheticum]MBX4272102.1 hypothetical protein [Clostridium estertheticum]WLC78895.1 hypothetical protein KTC98_17120 [Clostridium estertheticum]